MAGPVIISSRPQRTTTQGAPRPGMVRLTPSRGSDLTMILNKEPDRGGGVGGFETVERGLRRPAKWWKSTPDDTMTLDCTIDIDAIGGPSVERRLRVLRDMGQPGDDVFGPPSITLDGDVWESDKAIEWVMDDWTLGPRLWNGDGTIRRQQVTVELSRFEDVDEIRAIKVGATRTGKKHRRRRRTTRARGNDTLRAVALRELGDATRWKDLARWNKRLKGTDPDARLRTGTTISIR
jgi:hypothetical protein